MSPTEESRRDAPVYNIKAVSRHTGIPADTLRRWESRYHIITPQRTEGGYRLYSQRDVDTIHWLKSKLADGLSISRACEMLKQMGGDPGPVTAQASPSPAPVYSEGGIQSFDSLRADILDALRAVDEERAAAVLTAALGLYSVEDVCLEVLQPVLVEIGEAWHAGRISVAVEHFASGFVRTRLSNLFHSSHNNLRGPLVLVACAPNELHEIGPMFLAVFLRRAGFRVVYLGQNVPLDSLEGMIEVMRPDVVCISSTRADTAAELTGLREAVNNLQKANAKAPLLAYGGRAFNRSPEDAERLGGVYLGEDVRVAVERLSDAVRET